MCTVTFADGSKCSRDIVTQRFGGICDTCRRWAVKHDDTPHGRPVRYGRKQGKTCALCLSPVRSEGLCVIHYKRQLRHGDPNALKVMPPDAFYVVRGCGVVKPGITSGTLNKRLADHRRDGLTDVLFSRASMPDGLARAAETAVLRSLRQLGAAPVRGNEYFADTWTDVVLQLVRQNLYPGA